MDEQFSDLAHAHRAVAIEILREAIRIPADHVAQDPECGLSNHEGPRLEYLKRMCLEIGAVDSPDDIGFDAFGNLRWSVSDPTDGIPADDKVVVYLDGHTDTVQALRPRWHQVTRGGLDPYDGMINPDRVDADILRRELGYLPPDDQWPHLVWGRGSADQLGGVVCQIVATKILRELRGEGALRGIVVESVATVAEEDNDGGGPMYLMQHALRNAPAARVPDVYILTEGTGCSTQGALGIYRGQRGRMQIEVVVTGKSCHGSMPHEGRNPLEFGAAILTDATAAAAGDGAFGDDDFLGAGTRTASFATLDTPSDCAVPERFVFRFDRRLTAGEDPDVARDDIERLPSIARARDAGLTVDVHVPTYDRPTWRGYTPGNAQIYPGWVTPEDHPAIQAAVESYRRVISPIVANASGGGLRTEPRVSRWVFSTDGVGVPLPIEGSTLDVPPSKRWVEAGSFRHPAMFGIGPGIEQNTHKIGECVDARELAHVIAFLARFPSIYRDRVRS